MTTSTKVLELPNEIKKNDDKLPILVMQNFEAIASAIANIQKYLNENGYSVIEGTSDFEENAITYGANEPPLGGE